MQRPLRYSALLLLTLGGCRSRYTPPETPMPPNTILLSTMMQRLSAQPGFTRTLIDQIDEDGKKGPALLTPGLVHELRKRVLGKDWGGLDRFPGWTMRQINPTVRVAGHFAGHDKKLEGLSSVHPGSPAPAMSGAQARSFLDLGPYALDREETVSLDAPSTLPGFTANGLVTPLGFGVVRGDGPNALAPKHAASQRLADVLNRLSANGLEGAKPFTATLEGSAAHTPQELMALLGASGHQVIVDDARYFANFGHFHYKGEGYATEQDVMMPFWLNAQLAVPGTGGLFHRPRPLLVPASHAELEWHVSGPKINADVSYYFGVDGKSEWRTMDTLDQAWVLKRNAHAYSGADAVEVTRLTGLMTVMYLHQHAKRPHLPFGGYYALGVCQDGVSAIEKKMTGQVTLFPNTADDALLDDPRDAEINAMFAAIPKDRVGARPQPERIFGSLPTTNFSEVTIPGLGADLTVSYAAWRKGSLHPTHGRLFYFGLEALAAAAAGAMLALVSLALRRRTRVTR